MLAAVARGSQRRKRLDCDTVDRCRFAAETGKQLGCHAIGPSHSGKLKPTTTILRTKRAAAGRVAIVP
jgi:hypothetical protein